MESFDFDGGKGILVCVMMEREEKEGDGLVEDQASFSFDLSTHVCM